MGGNGRVSSAIVLLDESELGSVGEGVGRARVADIQRARMLGGIVAEIADKGVANVSVANVVARSGVSRRTFYEIFDDREDCFLAAFDDTLRGIASVVLPVYGSQGSWRAKIRAALTALLECLDYDRAAASLLIVESLAAGPRALERRRSVLAQLALAVEEGHTEGRGGGSPPLLTAEGVIGGVLSILHARLTEEDSGSLVELVGPLMGMIVLPYLGPAAARREIERDVPRGGVKRKPVRRNPLQNLEMRLTYRTVLVLRAVARAPGSSNRVLGDAAGIGDQGQVSKMLARLQRLGLVENRGIGAATRGEPNSWLLTEKGSEVHNAIANVRS